MQRSNSTLYRRRGPGFTLVELLVVVIIIGLSAALATPAIFTQMRQRRLREAAQQVAALYSSARMRALARGAAVQVNYEGNGQFSVFESIDGTAVALARNSPACGDEPGLGCLTNDWTNASITRRQVTSLALQSELAVAAAAPDGKAALTMSVCFTPMGRSFVGVQNDSVPVPLAGAPVFTFTRAGKWAGGYQYFVALLPNGVARMTRGEAAP